MESCEIEMLVPLAEVTSPAQGGGKAVALAELARNGIPVPQAYVIPPDAGSVSAQALLEALGGCVAVRSSASVEDMAEASFAGQFRSVLEVRTAEELREAVAACRRSVDDPAARVYCAARGLDPAAVRMAVLVQRMVRATAAGVLFTVHPMSGREDEMLIEACPGLGDGLLAGRVPGFRIRVRDGMPTGPTGPLAGAEARQLIEMGGRIQRLAGSPQDIEWAFEAGSLYVLQARPITRLGFGGVEGEWTNADFRDGGVSSGTVAPLLWSLYERAWDRALKGYLRDLRLLKGDFPAGRLLYGRPYWNLGAVKGCARKLPGFVEREFDRDLGVQPSYAGDGARTPATLRHVVRALPTVLAARRAFREQEARDRAILRSDLGRRFPPNPEVLGDDKLLGTFRTLVDEVHLAVEEDYFRTIFCLSIAKLDLHRSWRGLPVSYAKLAGGLDGLSHLQAAQALWNLAHGTGGTLEAFLAAHGHHGRRELDLRVPRWGEEPDLVAAMARGLVGTESPAERNRRQHRQFVEEVDRAGRALGPWRRGAFERKVARLRKFLWLREQMRDLSTQTYGAIRRYALEMGRRAAAAGCLRSAADVFYLTHSEIPQCLTLFLQDRVDKRRAYEEMYREFRAPNEVGRGFAQAGRSPAGRRLTGIGCSAGVAAGRVRVVGSLPEPGSLRRGDVLVCPFTDPGWTPLLSIAGAAVTESGGVLSHAAVLCREFGIPAVLNVAGATRTLRDGQMVRVDGENGYVDVL